MNGQRVTTVSAPETISVHGGTDPASLRRDIDRLTEEWKAERRIRERLQARVEKLEKWQMFCYGIAAAVSAILALLFQSLGM